MTEAQVYANIDADITANGSRSITGTVLNGVLTTMFQNIMEKVVGTISGDTGNVTSTDTLSVALSRLQNNVASFTSMGGAGTNNFLTKVTTNSAGTITQIGASRFFDDGTDVSVDVGVAGGFYTLTASKIIGIKTGNNDSYIQLNDDSMSFQGTRIHSAYANYVSGTPFSFINVSGISDATVAVFSSGAYGERLISSSVTSTELGRISGLTSNAQAQIDALTSGLSWKQAVRVATTANITLSGEQTIDGVTTSASRVLVKDQSTASQNGIYVSSAGAWARATDMDIAAEFPSATVAVSEGSTNADLQYVCTNDTVTVGSTSITWVLVGGTTYVGTTNRITVVGNTIDISSSYLGQNSIVTVGTLSAGAVPASLVTAGTFGTGAYTMATSLTTPSLIGVSGVQNYSTTAQATGSITDFIFTPSNHTGQTASTNAPMFRVASSTKTFAAGTIAAFYANHFQTQTISFASSSTVTESFGAYFESNTLGALATFTNSYSLGTNGFVKLGQGLTGTIIRNDVSTNNYTTFYNANITPSSSNYFIKNNSSTTFVNAVTGGSLLLTYNGLSVVTINATSITNVQGLNLRAGSTAAATAPLYWQSSTSLLTTIAAGAAEYNNVGYYFTTVSLNRTALGGVIADFTSDANNTGTGETDLYTYTTKASTLGSTGEKIVFKVSGTFNDITATAQLQFYFGGTSIGDTGALTVSATGAWEADVLIIRTGASTARAVVTVHTPSTTLTSYVLQTNLTGLTFTNTNIIKVTGTAGGGGGGSSDITAKLGSIWWWAAAANV